MLNIRWKTISIDFIIKLSKYIEFDAVITIVDSVSKRAHFVFTHTTVTIENTARLFLHHIWKLYSLSNHIVLD